MLEMTTTRHNPGIDPALHVWGWEIPLYLFLGGLVAGMMIVAGWAMLRTARGDDTKSFFSVQSPLLGFTLLNVGMLALLLDLAHPLYVWAVYLTLQPLSPMSWGSWVLLIVYAILLLSALVRLPQAWPWLALRVPALTAASNWILARPQRLRRLGIVNMSFGVGVGIYTGILLNTMVARPLWNTSVLPVLFLVSGLSAGVAAMHVASAIAARRPVSQGAIGGLLSAMVQPLGPQLPDRRMADSLTRLDIGLLGMELVLLALLLVSLATSTLSHIEAALLLTSGRYGWVFWLGVVAMGILVPMLLQALELGKRIPHSAVPAVLVLAGGFALRWVLVNAGQASQIVQATVP